MLDIPALSMAMSQNKVMSDFSVAMLDKSLDTFQDMGDSMTKLMEQSVNPNLGGNIDISV
ncbi:MAG: YjfB family protein [Lachnospiraceae bacterium]|nr:YjfB family protein [Lachnospiraceae bacterium]MBR5765725.1 YjfB family protein [Lachnospiraceae bacterium]MBR6469646.1 YjfB family protein [Lachnospiraceae bacterium]MBR6485401.1 YjfB family protein [Lachnospiraceae bacterium]